MALFGSNMKKTLFFILILACLTSMLYQEYTPIAYVEEELGDAEKVEAKKIVTTLEGKTKEEIADLKATELAKIDSIAKQEITFAGVTKEIEVLDIQKIDGGVQTFVRGWSDGKPLGFGKDGTVEIERFRVHNPPILVPDPLGDVVRTYTDQDGNTQEVRFREDPELALKQVLTQAVANTGKENADIEIGKVGNTTDVFAPSMDGFVSRQTSADTTWTLARDTADGTNANTTEGGSYLFAELRSGPARYEVARAFLIFDTSAIPDTNVIDSATTTMYSCGDTFGSPQFGLVQVSPASDSSLAVGDYDAMTINSATEGASRRTVSNTANAANNWGMNASGLSWVSTTGNTRLGLRHANDLDNTTPSARSYWCAWFVDNAGTSVDPVLTVTHSEGVPAETTVYPVTTMSQTMNFTGSVIIKP